VGIPEGPDEGYGLNYMRALGSPKMKCHMGYKLLRI